MSRAKMNDLIVTSLIHVTLLCALYQFSPLNARVNLSNESAKNDLL